MMTLRTTRLLLRPPADDDALAFAEMHADPEVAQYLVGGAPALVDADIAWRNIAMLVGHWQLRGFGSWVVEEPDAGIVIGRVGFWQPPSWADVELTWLIRRSHWGHGFATEAAHRAMDWLRTETRIDRVISLIHPDNSRSLRVASKLGQTHAATREIAGVVHHEYGVTLTR